ncbi:unnamed protein product [Staurois parvus]|uniref:Uncharacterized protein n=1 Tax=Staurois parvus TaxID=386267 RepID=A0ABN9BMX8_9NEOB|nr:unnamed protein product [Staurois parvus]
MSLFVIFKISGVPSPYVPTSQGRNPEGQMPLSPRGHCRGHCRRDIAGAQGQGKRRTDPRAAPHGSPSVARGYPLCYTREYRQGG